MELEALAPAKINLFLAVDRRRENGYHDIRTVFLPLSEIADHVYLTQTDTAGGGVECAHPDVPTGASNLCHKAVERFAAAAGTSPCWHIRIGKRIPVAAGLGGGSSDAAAVLNLLNRHYEHPLDDAALAELAAGIGADVPFFLYSRPAVAQGIGDQLETVAWEADAGIVLLNPCFPVSAGWAYRNYASVRRLPAPEIDLLLEGMRRGDLDEIAENTHNDLEFALAYKFPLIEMLKEFLLDRGCLAAHVSGSGPTVYGICRPGEEEAVASEAEINFADAVWIGKTRVFPETGAAGWRLE